MGVVTMKLFKQLCSIVVVFALLFSVSLTTVTANAENDGTPAGEEEIDDPGNSDEEDNDIVDEEEVDENDDDGKIDGEEEKTEEPDDINDPDDTEDDADEEDEKEIEEEEDDEDGDDEEDIYALLDIYKVILPTTGSLDFVVDPLGLAGLSDGDVVTMDELDSGRIYPKSIVPAMVFSESSMPLKLTVSLRAESRVDSNNENDMVRFISPGVNLDRTRDAVFAGRGLNVLLYAVPSKNGITTFYDEYYPSDIGFVITEKGTEMTFLLPAAEYIYDEELEDFIFIQGSGNGTQIRIGGYANDNSDWSSYIEDRWGHVAGSISLNAVFTVTRLYDDEFELSTEPVDGVMYLRAITGSYVHGDIVILDQESIEALIPHSLVSETTFTSQNSSSQRRRGKR